MTSQRLFEFDADSLEYRFVEEVGRKTLYIGVIARLFLGSSWALAWRKVVSLEGQTLSSWRCGVMLTVWMSGAACQVISAGMLLRERQPAKLESLKGRQFVATIILAMVASIMAREKEAQTAMATALPCVIIDGGILIFEQFRFQSQLQLQAFQVIAFIFMEAGALSFNNKDVWKCLRDIIILMPLIIVGEVAIAAWLELRSREAFLRKHQQPLSHLGTFWQRLWQNKQQLKAQLSHAKKRQL
ncbi:hypothetical protein COCOBI_16-1720 [Coccomyxa sp. Obi]|nr:hypothetical protein COCOBI_16-1720 [Coccomyxa sp. Obi]